MACVENILFRAELRPNASASPRAFLILAWLLGGLAGATGTVFLLLGAWPVLPFMGVEIGAALLLLRWHRIATTREAELLELTERRLTITRTDRRGQVRGTEFEPYWLRTELSGTPPRVWLTSHGRRVSVGNALTPEERRDLHAALKDALERWRTAPGG